VPGGYHPWHRARGKAADVIPSPALQSQGGTCLALQDGDFRELPAVTAPGASADGGQRTAKR